MNPSGQPAHPVLLRLAPLVLVLGGLTAWELLARGEYVSTLFFPAPSVIMATIYKLTVDGEMAANAGATLQRLLTGFAMGGALGFLVGMLMGWSPAVRRAFDPLVAATHPVPKISTLPLIMLIFGIGALSKMLVVAVGAFFPMLINTMAGVRQISPIYFEVAENYGARPRNIFTQVVLPGSLPMVLAGARLALNTCLSITIAVELVTADNGLGSMIWLAWETLRVEELYATILVIAILGITFRWGLQTLSVKLVPWQPERSV